MYANVCVFFYICSRFIMAKKVTIKDIAEALDTTSSTVSRALNNAPGIGEEKRKKIIALAGEMGYEPNLFARQLRQGGSRTIGLIVPRINRVFFSSVIHGVETIARERGFSVIICQSHEDRALEEENIKTLISNHVAGILMSLSKDTYKAGIHLEILKRNIPFVMFDRVFDTLDTNKVVNDNFHASQLLTEHLLEQGYKKIVHFAGPAKINIYRDRLNGFLKALEDCGIKPDNGQIIENVITKDQGMEETNRLIDSAYQFDAIVAASDFSALGAMLSLKDHKIEVPGMVGVAGFANEPFAELLELTSVDQQSTEVGRTAARLLFESIELESNGTSKEIVIKPELIIRKSTLNTG